MDIDKLVLNWNGFEDNSRHTFRQLWEKGDFTDVTLATMDDQQIKAHKVILSSSSEFFRKVLLKNAHPHPLLYLKDIRHKDLDMVVRFIYLGQCALAQEDLESFLNAGKVLGIYGLIDYKDNINQLVSPEEDEPQEELVSKEDEFQLKIKTDIQSMRKNAYKKFQKQTNGKYHCDICDVEFSTFQGIFRHNQAKHEGITFDCDQCEYKATSQSHLKTHIQCKHEGFRHSCDQCNQKFWGRSSVNKHKRRKHRNTAIQTFDRKYYIDQI